MNARVLVAYASTHGHTAKIADRIAQGLREHDVSVHVREIGTPGAHLEPAEFDGVVVGASVHLHHHQRAVIDWIAEHRTTLNGCPSAFFSVSLTAADDTDEARAATRAMIADVVDRTGWTPATTAAFAGAFEFREYNLPTRVLMHLIANGPARRARVVTRPGRAQEGRAHAGEAEIAKARGHQLRAFGQVLGQRDEDDARDQRHGRPARKDPGADHADAEAEPGDDHERPVEEHPRPQVVAQRVEVAGPLDERVDHGVGEEDVDVGIDGRADPTQAAEVRALDDGQAEDEHRERRLGDERQPQLAHGEAALRRLDGVGDEVHQ